MVILGIETSCDETAVSMVEAGGDLNNLHFKVLGSAVQSQIEIHKQYGGVFPTLAKREHIKNLPLVLEQALKEAGLSNSKLQIPSNKQVQNVNVQNQKQEQKSKIDLIVVTIGPGLEPALWTGINFAEELKKKWNIPVIGANHMEGHIASVLFNDQKIEFPAVALLISGGHTKLVFLKNWIEKEKIGETQDDAVGEAFDKVARMLGLPYPGGPEISRLAEEAREKNVQLKVKFPRPMIYSKDFNFSFSGLKTAVLYYIREITHPKPFSYNKRGVSGTSSLVIREEAGGELSYEQKMEIAGEFEDAVIEILITKTKKAIDRYLPKTLIIGGGVIANKALRENFINLEKNYPGMKILIPNRTLTTDNAVMIAAAGYIEHLKNTKPVEKLTAQGNLKIT